jgi:hypothetical protein
LRKKIPVKKEQILRFLFLENIVHIDRGICDAAEKLGVQFTVEVF